MRYKSRRGQLINVEADPWVLHHFINQFKNIYLPTKTAERCDTLRRTLGIMDLAGYLRNALKSGRCIIVERDPITFYIRCNRLDFIVDSETLEILGVLKRGDRWS